MKKFTAFAIAILFLMFLVVPCFADDDSGPKDSGPKIHQPVTLDVSQ